MKILKIDITPTTDTSIDSFDNTKLVAINTCPTWGIIRYSHHKTFSGMGRAMALEAGAAAHEVFAAHRLYSLREYGKEFYGFGEERVLDLTTRAGHRIFGPERYAEMVNAVDESEDFRTRCNQFSLEALYNSGFYDDPGERRKTMTNIEETCLAYMDRFDWKDKLPVVFDNEFVGIEIPVDVTLDITYVMNEGGEELTLIRRFIGKADGVHWTDRSMTEARISENKTASRLGDAWELSWETNSQPTGYMLALSAMLGLSITRAEILGSCLPLPKSVSINGLSRVVATRHTWQFNEWLHWFLHTVLLHDDYVDHAVHAPKYTHSCNRYFRPCAFIPLCATPPEDRQAIMDDMAVDKWTPLDPEETVK